MNELQMMNAREAMQVMRDSVTRELDDLYRERRDHLDVIKSQEKQIRILREDKQFAELRRDHESMKSNDSILFMFMACVVSFIAVGYAVWIG